MIIIIVIFIMILLIMRHTVIMMPTGRLQEAGGLRARGEGRHRLRGGGPMSCDD